LTHELEIERGRSYDDRRQIDEILAAAATAIRERFWEKDAIESSAHATADITEGFGVRASIRTLTILSQTPLNSVALSAFVQASHTIVNWWDIDKDRDQHGNRDFESEAAILDRLQRFLMQATSESAYLEQIQFIPVHSRPR
jgi:hypothetical protein